MESIPDQESEKSGLCQGRKLAINLPFQSKVWLSINSIFYSHETPSGPPFLVSSLLFADLLLK